MIKGHFITLELTELDVKILLEALSMKQFAHYDARRSTQAVDILIERIHRALGIRLDKDVRKQAR